LIEFGSMSSKERVLRQGSEKKDSILNSRLVKGGGVIGLVGLGFGVGILVEVGALAAAIGAGWWAIRGNKSK